MRFRPALMIICLLLFNLNSDAQQTSMDNVWPLQRCVQHAISHNIAIRQDSLTARLARYSLTQSQLSQLPSLNVSGNYGQSSGRSINPTTNQFENQGYSFLGPSANSSVLLWGWSQVCNTIARNRYSLEASLADLDQRRNDISLNVANGYLVALLAKEQINISTNQVNLSKAQLDQTRAFADAGRLPELNVAQLESQLATDSSNLINAIANYNSAILDLKTLLNLNFDEPFDVQAPDMSMEDKAIVLPESKEVVFQSARGRMSSVKASQLRVTSAERSLAAAKAGRYPQLNLSYQVGTNYASNYLSYQQTNEIIGLTPVGITGGDSQIVYAPRYKTLTPLVPFDKQMSNNLRQTIVLNLNIPLFNGWQSQYAVKQAGINLEQQRNNEYNTELTLQQSVYKAHNNAQSSIQKYNAAKHAHDAAKRALDFAKKRYELGLTSTVDLLVTQNSEFAAAAN